MSVGPRQVVRTYLVLAGLYTLSASLIWGVNTLFLLDAGLDLFEVFVANAAFTAGMVLFEIPTGVVADTRGRRVSFLLSLVVLTVGTLGYVALAEMGLGVVAFSLMSVVLGLGFTFYSGAVEAWLVDALEATGHDGELDPVFAQGAQVTGAAMLVGTVGGGVLGDIDLSLPFLVRSGLLALLFVVTWGMMRDLGFERRPVGLRTIHREMVQVARLSLELGWRRPAVRLLTLVAFFQLGFMAWGWYAWQPHLLDLLGQDAVWVAGVIAAAISLSMILGNRVAEHVGAFCARRTTVLLWGTVALAVAMVGVGLAGSFALGVGLFLVGMAATGVMGPVRQAYLHKLVPSKARATIISFDGLMGSAGGVANQLALGRIAQTGGLGLAYVLGGMGLSLSLPVLGRLRGKGQPEDRIRRSAGVPAPCAAQGVPDISGVDASAYGVRPDGRSAGEP